MPSPNYFGERPRFVRTQDNGQALRRRHFRLLRSHVPEKLRSVFAVTLPDRPAARKSDGQWHRAKATAELSRRKAEVSAARNRTLFGHEFLPLPVTREVFQARFRGGATGAGTLQGPGVADKRLNAAVRHAVNHAHK